MYAHESMCIDGIYIKINKEHDYNIICLFFINIITTFEMVEIRTVII